MFQIEDRSDQVAFPESYRIVLFWLPPLGKPPLGADQYKEFATPRVKTFVTVPAPVLSLVASIDESAIFARVTAWSFIFAVVI